MKIYESEINSQHDNINFIDKLKNCISIFCKNNNVTRNNKEYLLYELKNSDFFIQECQDILSNKHNLAVFNKIVGKNYTIESLHRQISKLIYGYLYLQIPKYLNTAKKILKSNTPVIAINHAVYHMIQDFKITNQFCQEHFNMTLNDFNKYAFNIDEIDSTELILKSDYEELHKDFAEAFRKASDSQNIDRHKYLLELDNDDKIGRFYGEIDYDPHNVSLRDAPIIIYKDNKNEDHVLIGKYGQHHIDLYPTEEDRDNHYVAECYYYKPCVFVDRPHGYSIEDVVSILKNDSRFKKIYLTPPINSGGQLKRLAQKI